MSKEVQFRSILARLLKEQAWQGNQRDIAAKLFVSPSALSQYIAGRAKPSFDVLVTMSELFGVSLDYLVHGESAGLPVEIDYGPVVRHITAELGHLHDQDRQRIDARRVITQALIDRMEEAVESLIVRGIVSPAVLTEEQVSLLEAHAVACDLLVPNLHEDLIALPDGEHVGGYFIPVVAANLLKGRKYRFLLPAGRREWTDDVSRLRRVIANRSSWDVMSSNTEFRVTAEPIYAGFAVITLNPADALPNRQGLDATVAPFVSADGQLAYLQPPSLAFRGSALLEAGFRDAARDAFALLWSQAESI